jgi:hypothetical protein
MEGTQERRAEMVKQSTEKKCHLGSIPRPVKGRRRKVAKKTALRHVPEQNSRVVGWWMSLDERKERDGVAVLIGWRIICLLLSASSVVSSLELIPRPLLVGLA